MSSVAEGICFAYWCISSFQNSVRHIVCILSNILNKSVNEVCSKMPNMQYNGLILIIIKFRSFMNSRNIYLDYVIINRSIPVSVKLKMGLKESNLLFLCTNMIYLWYPVDVICMFMYVLCLCSPPNSVHSKKSEQNPIIKGIRYYPVLTEISPRRQCEFIIRVEYLYLFYSSQFHAFYLLGHSYVQCVLI